MKKIIALALTLALAVTMGSIVFAATELPGPEEENVNATYLPGDKDDAYFVTIAWGPLAYTYKAADQVWNAESHKFEASTEEGSWTVDDEDGDKITVTNDSSVAIDATLKYAEQNDSAVVGTFDDDGGEIVLELPIPPVDNGAVPQTATLALTGKPVDDPAIIGKVTITLADAS